MKWHIAILGCCILTGTAFGQDFVPRSSSPTGIRPDAASIQANFPIRGTQSAQTATGTASASQTYTHTDAPQSSSTTQQSSGKGVAIQGKTSVNATARSMGSQAIGAGNTSCASLGSIGECAPR